MDALNFMGLLGQAQGGDPETTGAVSAKMAGAPMPESAAAAFDPNSGAVEYNGSDPELAAYARMGIDPDLIRAKRADSIQRMAMILMGGGPGVDTSNQGAQLAAASDMGKDIEGLMRMKSAATRDQLEKGKLSLMQQKLLGEAAAQARYQESIKNGQNLLLRLAGGGAIPTTGGSDDSLAAAAGYGGAPVQAPALADPATTGGPAGIPGGGRVDMSGIPGQGGTPPLTVTGSGAGAPAEANVAQPNNPAVVAYSAAKNDPRLRAALTPEMAAVLAAQLPNDEKGVYNRLWEQLTKKTYQNYRTPDGYLVQRDSDGHYEAPLDYRTEGEKLAAAARQKALENASALDLQRQQIPLGVAKLQAEMPVELQKHAGISAMDLQKANAQGDYTAGRTALGESAKEAKAASDSLEQMNQARELINAGIYSGTPLAMAQSRVSAILAQHGYDNLAGSGDQAARTAALQSISRGLAKSAAKGLGVNPTDADLRSATEQAGADPSKLTTDQMLRIFAENERINAAKIKDYQDRRTAFSSQLPQAERSRIDANFPNVTDPGRFYAIKNDSKGVPHRVYLGRDGKFLRAEQVGLN